MYEEKNSKREINFNFYYAKQRKRNKQNTHKNAELATASLMCDENGSFCHHRSSLSNARVNINTLQYMHTNEIVQL